ncbi:MAG: hypothetical protein IKN72_11815 [Clostridia bacterium]|nr:hypothetical protein [Clostridia bacterium]
MNATDVFGLLKGRVAFSLPADETVLSECDRALQDVIARCKPDVSEDTPLIAVTAAAIARYHLFLLTISDADRFDSFKAGDLSVTRDSQKELALERLLLEEALTRAAEILTDRGFFFGSV